jgi:hypothetical protein
MLTAKGVCLLHGVKLDNFLNMKIKVFFFLFLVIPNGYLMGITRKKNNMRHFTKQQGSSI